MHQQMKVAVMRSPGAFEFEQRDIPEIGPLDALVQVNYVGVCGSDMALFENGFIGSSVVTEPMVLGHEASGTVVRVGESVTDLAPGDRVALEPGVPCGACDFCVSGKYNLCRDVYFWASLPVTEGTLQEYVRHPARFCFKLPDDVSLAEGALVEPLAVAFHAVQTARPGVGSTAVVLGAGAVGILTLLTLRAAGVATVVVVDLVSNRLDQAERLGAEVINSAETDLLSAIRDRFGHGPDYVFETAGNAVTMDQAISIVRPGGTITLVGYTKDGRADLNVNLLIDKEITVRTVFRYRNVYPKAIAAVSAGTIPLKEVVSAVFDFDEAQSAMETAIHRKDEVSKCLIAVKPEGGGQGS